MRGPVAVLGLVAGCELAFPLDPPVGDARPSDCGIGAPDEDGDEAPDDCDLCPHLPGTPIDGFETGADADGDTVGDRCDPAPAIRARGRWFDGMNTADRWTANGWTFDGAAVPPVPATDLLGQDTFGRVHVETWFHYFDVPAGAPVVIGVWAMARPHPRGVPDGYACVVVKAPAGETSIALARSSADAPGDLVLSQPTVPLSITPGVAHVIRLDMPAPGALSCRVFATTGELEAAATATDGTFTAGHVGVRAEDVGAYLEYFFVVED